MRKADKLTLSDLELLDMWREKQPDRPSRLKALKRIEMPPKAIAQILGSEDKPSGGARQASPTRDKAH
jgi:hypothetical protein